MIIKKLVTQGGADTFVATAIQTGLTADGKAGWQLQHVSAQWVDGASIAAADYTLSAKVATIATTTGFDSQDELARVMWGAQNTAGVAVAFQFEPIKAELIFEPRVTVQPILYLQVESAGTANANDVVFVITYELIKLSDLEVMRLLVGGA
jgi:hypothetical protein